MQCLRVLFCIAALCYYTALPARNVETDSLKKVLAATDDDTKRVSVLESLSYAYLSSYPDTALQYALKGLQLAQNIKYLKGQAMCINAIGNVYFHTGDNAKALEMYLRYLEIKESLKDFNNLAVAYFNISAVYTEEQDYQHALYYIFKAKVEDEKAKDTSAILYDLYSLGSTYLRMQKTDSALYYNDQCYQLVKYLDDKNMRGAVLNNFGEIYLAMNDPVQAEKYYNLSIPPAEEVSDFEVLNADYYGLSKIYKQEGNTDSSIHYARLAFNIAWEGHFYKQAFETSTFLTDLFQEKNKYDSAFRYQQLRTAIKDSLFNTEQVRKLQDLKFNEQQRQQAIATERMKYQNNIKLSVAISVSVIILIIAIVLLRNNKDKLKANLLLSEQKAKVESALSELKTTQAQLIQSEKMASLGELTAGIAHEIQNPLNFVNNFSDVNGELIDELEEEIDKGNLDEVKAIAKDIKENEIKIKHHGKRAEVIVKGMLLHSRKSTGQKEPTDINDLADEYLKLSYHGLRAKDKSLSAGQAGFNAEIKTDFDKSIGKINVVPQDIGRVLLNIFNNAFYAVKLPDPLKDEQYKPLVSVTTRKINSPSGEGSVEIIIADNGNGIPENIIDKIFQPFFTTKPTGQGTGLGLSLAYDIIKTHGGDIKVETKEGEGSEFVIVLPV